MRFSVPVLLLAAFTSATELKSRNNQKTEDETKTEKRELAEGSSGVEKRLAVPPTALPSEPPGIVYADTKGALQDKSPIQQIYATPVPQIAKISDVLTGHGPAFPAAIASHLYSPIQVYQPKLATPTTYEVSAPVPSQLAYAEKISYQSPVQFTTQVLYNQQPQFPKQINFPRYNAVQIQPAFQPQNPRLFTHPQTFQAPQVSQVVLNQQPQFQNPQYQNGQNPQAIYSQVQQQLAQLAQTVQPQPGVVYARQENVKEAPKPIQKQENSVGCCGNGNKPQDNSEAQQNRQPQTAISFASFSQAQPTYTQQQPQKQAQAQNQYQVQHQYQQAQPQQQTQYQVQQQPRILIQVPSYQYQARPEPQAQEIRQYQAQEQPQPQSQGQPQAQIQYQPQPHPLQYQLQPTLQYQPQPQIQYQAQPPAPLQIQIPQYQPKYQFQQVQQPQFISKLESPPTNSIATAVKPVAAKPLVYLRPQDYQYQPQAYQGTQQPGLAFPAVQYFGKFAQEIFGGYQQNQ